MNQEGDRCDPRSLWFLASLIPRIRVSGMEDSSRQAGRQAGQPVFAATVFGRDSR